MAHDIIKDNFYDRSLWFFGRCYGLNVSPPNPDLGILLPNVMVLGGEVSEMWLGSEEAIRVELLWMELASLKVF